MAHYVDFVGLNTFIYEPVGYDLDLQDLSGIYGSEELTVGGRYQEKQQYFGIFEGDSKPDYSALSNYKNYLFPHNLPTTASFFPALMLKRNGPYGFPTWKQIRIGQNPLTRRQNKENVFTFVEEPGPEFVFNNNGKLNVQRSRYGAIKKFNENPVSSRYKPFKVGAASIVDDGTLERFELLGTYGNETIFFNNKEINKYNDLRVQRSAQYNTIKDFYLNGGLDKDGSPFDTFEYFNYRECVYPPRVYQYKNYTRQRTTFSFPWRDDRGDRTETNIENGFGSTVHQSKWILDANSAWPAQGGRTSKGSGLDVWFFIYGYQNPLDNNSEKNLDFGILQNTYCFGSNNIIDSSSVSNLPDAFRIAPLYNRKHTLTPSSSVVSPNGMILQGINSGSTFGNMTSLIEVPSGEAKWEAGSQSGLNPFYDTYDNYIQDVRQHGKDYSIIPEFRISEHIETYESTGLTEEVSNIFSLTGALSNTTDSSKDDFYKIYSTSEFMKHFEVVKKDHKEFVPASSISLKCKAIKKFLPYEGFYPAQRSVDLAKQFYNSYKDFTAASGAVDQYGTPNENPVLFQNLMVPTFAPGIFFNTIKAGVAVDYPLIDSNLSIATNVTTSNGNYYIKATTVSPFNRRIPFEALVEPENHLAGSPVYCNEPHIYANNSGSVSWDGGGNNRYKLMANNFLAETTEFFMREKNMTQITSLPSNDPNVGVVDAAKTYMMRVKMYKSSDQATIPNVSSSGGFYTPPQYGSSSRETFTMYSRPSAFGPPLYLTGNLGAAYYDLPLADQGENYAFTPPYYYGQSWADITFTPTRSGKHSIQEIISGSTVAFHRYAPTETGNDEFFRNLGINAHAMDLNASVNLFSQTTAGTSGADPNDPPSRWVIQTKFETPMLNFNHLSASDSITLPDNASQSVPRGMWHQYGNIESDPTKGIFLQVDSVPDAWIDESLGLNPLTFESLADLCGFTTEAKRLGEVADTKEIREAVVAVPFIEEEGNRKFFRIPRIDITRAFGTESERALVGDSVLKMIVKMQGYVMPPSMDFLNNNTVDPFAMYIFEFSHTLKKQDLANIWQNLYPEIGQTFETAESSISHELLAHELLGGGAKLNPEGTLDVNAVGNEIPDRVRWMVFKIKQRANIDYNLKIIGRGDINIFEGANTEITYNWPYDFFSLVELAKIETEVKFAERAVKSGQEPRDTIVPVFGNKVGAGGTSLDATLKGTRPGQAARNRRERRIAERQAETRQKAAAKELADALNAAAGENAEYQQALAEDRARLKSYGALGDGDFELWQKENPQSPNSEYKIIIGTQKNSDYDGDGRRDIEDGGYDAPPKPEDN